MKTGPFILALLLGLLWTAPAWAVNPDEMLADPVLEKRAREISKGLRCLVCQNQSIDDSDADLAKDLRARLGRLVDLGRAIRLRGAEIMADRPEQGQLFINIHPHDLLDDELLDPESPLSRMAERVVLEITERAELPE